MGYDGSTTSMESPESFGKGPQAIARRWRTELRLARQLMRPWRERSKKLWDLYHAAGRKKNSYNMLYANTEVLAPSVYNTLPIPDTRRRFSDNDELGKNVAEVIDRCLSFNAETTGFDTEIRADVLDMLITGRGFSRVRYVPSLIQVGESYGSYTDTKEEKPEGIEVDGENEYELEETDTEHEAQQGEQNEELECETAPIEHVKWDQYLLGPGRCFKEIQWIAFKHELTRDELVERFGEVGDSLELSGGPDDPDLQRSYDSTTLSLFKTAEVWEIWDKEERCVYWISESYLDKPLLHEDDPLGLENFFPIVDPLRAIANSDTFEPLPLYEQYREQAEELDRISTRINKLVDAIKARAIYDPSLGTMVAELFRGNDNDLIPADISIKQLYEAGGIERAIWFAPIDKMANVVQILYTQREQCKQVIYEINGIADIMRGSTNAAETYGAQALKTAFGMTRLSRMQRDVQRYIRDMFALQAEVICKNFELETIQHITNLKLPSDAIVLQQAMMMMQQSMMARMQGGNPPPLPPKPVTWEDVYRAMQDDATRAYKVDIETNSTIAASQLHDVEKLTQGMSALTAVIEKLWPLVQQQVLPFESAKEIAMSIIRKFDLGKTLEDAFDTIHQPPPAPQNPAATMSLQIEQMRQQGNMQKMQAEFAMDQKKAELDAQVAYAQQDAQQQQYAAQAAIDGRLDQMKAENQAMLEQMKMENDRQKQMMENQVKLLIAAMDNRTKMEIAELNAGSVIDQMQVQAAVDAINNNQVQ